VLEYNVDTKAISGDISATATNEATAVRIEGSDVSFLFFFFFLVFSILLICFCRQRFLYLSTQ